jgi:hypothetical protein
MFNQFLDPAREVAAELVDNVCLDVRPILVDQFREGHAVQVRGFRNLLKGHPTPFPEFEVGDPFFQFEP